MTNVGGATNTLVAKYFLAKSRNLNICTKYGVDMTLIISGSYGGHRGYTTDNARVMA